MCLLKIKKKKNDDQKVGNLLLKNLKIKIILLFRLMELQGMAVSFLLRGV